MKRTFLTLFTLVALTLSAHAMSYSKASEQALFLSDKMAYELGLSDDQYNAVYEINLDYFMSISSSSDILGTYWARRNTDLQYVLTVAQYQAYTGTSYFYQPVSWVSNAFSFLIYNVYTKKKYYNAAPSVYGTYQGGNRYYTESPYKGRTYGTETKIVTTTKKSSTTTTTSSSAKKEEKAEEPKTETKTETKTDQKASTTSSSSGRTSSSSSAKDSKDDKQSGGMSKSEAVSKGKENTDNNKSGGKR